MSAEVSQSISYFKKKASEDIKTPKIVSLVFLYQIPVCHKSFHTHKLEMGLLQQWIVFAGGCSNVFVQFHSAPPHPEQTLYMLLAIEANPPVSF